MEETAKVRYRDINYNIKHEKRYIETESTCTYQESDEDDPDKHKQNHGDDFSDQNLKQANKRT